MSPITSPDAYHAVFHNNNGGDCEAAAAALLQYAFRLWSEGHEVPAAVLARAAVERHAAWICSEDYRIEKIRRPHPCSRIHALTLYGFLDRVSQKYLLKALGSLNSAAHGNPVTFEKLANGLRIAAVFCRLQPTRIPPAPSRIDRAEEAREPAECAAG